MRNVTSFLSWPRCLLALLGLLGSYASAFAAPPRPSALLAGPTPVGNYVFLDANLNNVFDAAETGIPGVRVCLYTSDGVLRETATTTATGLFSFTTTIQPNTSYDIRIKAADAPANRRLVVAKQGGDPTADSDASMVGNTAVIVVQSNATGTLPTALGFGYAAGDPDLILTKVSDSFSVAKGGTATFTLSVSNVGGSTATGVVLRDTLDAGMGYVSSSPAGTTALLGSGNVQVTWTTGTLSAGTAATYTLTVSALTDGVLTNTAGVTATSADGTPRNNLASASFSVPAKLCQGGAYVTTLANNLTNVEWFKAGASVGTGNSLTIVTSGSYSYTAFSVGSACQVVSCSPVIIYDGSVPNLTLARSATAICVGQSSVLSVSNCAGTVLWNTGAATTSITVSPTITTGYSVTCTPTAVDACPSSVSATVTVNPSVTATVASQTICNGLTATLSASAAGGTGITYVWVPAGTGNTQSVMVSPSITTSYTVTATNSDGCSTTATATVTVNSAVTAVIAANPSTTICNGTSTTLTASATGGTGFTYLWSTGAVTASIPVSPTVTTAYTVTATNGFGCSSTASTTITVNPSVTATLTSSTICYGTVASLSATGGTSYAFSNGTTNTTGIVSVTPLVTTTYNVTVTNGNGCSAIATGTVTVNPAVTATIGVTPALTICQGNAVTLTANATGGTTYNYTWSTGAVARIITASPTSTTVYSVTISEGTTSCSAIASTTITVNPTPVLSVNSPTICQEQTTTLSLTGCAGTVTWSTGTTGATLDVTPLQTTSYTATCGLTTGCSATIVTTVTVNLTPVVQRENVVVTRATCTGATANNDATIALTNLQNTARVSISVANGSTTPAYGAATTVPGTAYTFTGLPNPLQPVTYLISLYSANGTCTSTVTVTLNPADCTCPAPKCVPVVVRKIR